MAIINSYNCGSTGTIACKIGDFAEKDGYEVLRCFPKHKKNIEQKKENQILFGIPFLYKINDYLCKITGLYGFFQFYNTRKLIKELKKFKPSVVHLHNLHSSYVNLKILFNYLSKSNVNVVWTLHDCWALTGHCSHFTLSKCEKWKYGCNRCKRHYVDYPKAFTDVSALQWKRKKKLFTKIEKIVFVTPSLWLNGLFKQSFLNNKKNVVIRNGIDLRIFKPTASDFREKYGIPSDKFIILGVAFGWNYTKGFDVFLDLADRLDDSYQIVLVGTNEIIDRKLPDNIISIHRTADQFELAKIYSAADLFMNPTRQEMLGMVNIEANACGVPVVTYNTGGSPECILSTSGYVCKNNDIDELISLISEIRERRPFISEKCVDSAKRFNQDDKYSEYIELLNEMLGNNV